MWCFGCLFGWCFGNVLVVSWWCLGFFLGGILFLGRCFYDVLKCFGCIWGSVSVVVVVVVAGSCFVLVKF